MILFFIPTTDNLSRLIQKQENQYRFEEKKYILPRGALKHYRFDGGQTLTVGSVSSFISALIRILSFKNKERAYLYLTGSERSSLLIKMLGLISTSTRKMVNESGDYFDAYNIFNWMKYFRWRTRESSSLSLLNKDILFIPFSFLFVIIRSSLCFVKYKFKRYKKRS